MQGKKSLVSWEASWEPQLATAEQSCPSTRHGHRFRKSGATTTKNNAQQQQRVRKHLAVPKGRKPLACSPVGFFIRSDLDTNLKKKFTQMNKLCFDIAGLQASLHTATLDKYLTPLVWCLWLNKTTPVTKPQTTVTISIQLEHIEFCRTVISCISPSKRELTTGCHLFQLDSIFASVMHLSPNTGN